MLKRSRTPSNLTQNCLKKKVEVPYFNLVCIKSDYPRHLFVGKKYILKLNDRNEEGEVPVYARAPGSIEKGCIGYFSLSCFNVEPVRQWINNQKQRR